MSSQPYPFRVESYFLLATGEYGLTVIDDEGECVCDLILARQTRDVDCEQIVENIAAVLSDWMFNDVDETKEPA